MFRLVSINTLALLIISPLLVASATAEQGGADTALNSLHSVVSYRGVRIAAVQPAEPPAAAEVQSALPVPPPPVEDTRPALADPPPLVQSAATEPVKTKCGPVRASIHDANSSQKKAPSKQDFGRVLARIHDAAPAKAAAAEQKYEPRQKSVPAPAKGGRGAARAAAPSGHGGILSGIALRGAGAGGSADDGQCGRCGRAGILGRGGARAGDGQGLGPGCAFCQMYPHYAYYPEMHGYYYFKPYNWSRVAEQRETAMSWGEEPQNPYAATLFDRVYAEYRADQEAAAAGPDAPPAIEPELPPVPPESN